MIDKENEIIETIKGAFRLQNLIVFSLAFFGLAGLGLMNWADLSYDRDGIDPSFALHTLFQVFSYGSIIGAFSVHQLSKKKAVSKEYIEAVSYIGWASKFYRREYLDEMVYRYNMKNKREAYIEKHQGKLDKLLDKFDKVEYHRAWKLFKEAIKEEVPEDFNFKHSLNNKQNKKFFDYVLSRYRLEDKLKKVDEDYEDENIKYDKLYTDDLIVGISKSNKRQVPRGSEGQDVSFGVGRQMLIMFTLSISLSLIVISSHDNWIDATIKTLLTIFFVFLSAMKGVTNGERVFENTTLFKVLFRKNRLHEYVIYEASENSYVLPKEEENV